MVSRLREASENNWRNPEYARLVIERLKEKFKSPQLRVLMSNISLAWWAKPENREWGERHLAKLRAAMPRISRVQKHLYERLTALGVAHVEESDATMIGPYAFDCLIPKHGQMTRNLFIEMQGDYWHSLARGMLNDRRKFRYVNDYFPEYEIMYVWEHELKEGVADDRLISKFGLATCRHQFDFSTIELRQLNYDQAKKFFDNYHYLGAGSGGFGLGAYLNGELIAGVALTSPLRQNTAQQFDLLDQEVMELSRLCIHPHYHKKNMASWLTAKTIQRIPKHVKLIVSYADTTVGHNGTIYRAAGFDLHHMVAPDYWYITPDNWVKHKRTVYGQAVRAGVTERQYAEERGYLKKYGGEKLCFVKELR